MSYRNYSTANGHIVDASGNGDYTTIASAITAASSGQTIFIRPGTYTENLTLKAGVDLVSFGAEGSRPNVTISGKLGASFSGAVTINGIRLQTNADFAIEMTGANATLLTIENCYLNCTNATGISSTGSNASAKVTVRNCRGNLGTTGIAIFSVSNGGIEIQDSLFTNTGASTTANTLSSGAAFIRYSIFFNPITTSSTGAISIQYSFIDTLVQNVTSFNSNGSAISTAFHCMFRSGSASAISVGSGLNAVTCSVESSNTNAITGAGTLTYNSFNFFGTSSNINTTTQATNNSGPKLVVGSANSGGLNQISVTNTSNTASSNARFVALVQGASSEDPFSTYTVSGVTDWSTGIDNSDSDRYKISVSSTLGTNDVMSIATTGEINYPFQPSFLAVKASTQTDVTGDGTAVTSIPFGTEIFDQNGDYSSPTFTAPVTGRYLLGTNLTLTNLGAAFTSAQITLVTSNRTYFVYSGTGAIQNAAGNATLGKSFLCDMDAADTATVSCTVTGSTKTVDIFGDGTPASMFFGDLLA